MTHTSKQNGSQKFLTIAAVAATDAEAFIRKHSVTLSSLVALGIRGEQIEFQWLADGYPSKVETKIDIPVTRTPGFHYFGSVQKWSAQNTIFVEAEPEATRNPQFAVLVQAVTNALLDDNPKAKPVRDLLLATPKDAAVLDNVRILERRVEPIWQGKGASAIHLPRLARDGLFAARDRQLLFFAFRAEGQGTAPNHYEPERGRVAATLNDTIEYLNRVNPEKATLVATTVKGLAHALYVRDINADIKAEAKVLAKTEVNAQFVGTPAGNGIPYIVELGQKGGERTFRLTAKQAAGHVRELVQHAC